jgi:hypothetical protein
MKTKPTNEATTNNAKGFGLIGAGIGAAVVSVLAAVVFPAMLPPHPTVVDLARTAGILAFALTGWLLPCAIAASQRRMKSRKPGPTASMPAEAAWS